MFTMIDANSQFFAILTNVGMAKQANADALGIAWKITEMGVGDANPAGVENPANPVPSPAQTKLLNEWRRKPLNQLKIDPVNPAVLIAEQIIPADEGGHWIREIGLYDADGDLVAVANCAPSFKPILSQGSGRTQIVRMNFIVTSTGNITLKIDPAIVLASRAYVDAAILEVLPKNKTPGEWTRVKTNDRGIVVSGDNPETLAGMGIKDSYTKAEIEAMIAQASALPVGTTVAFPAGTAAPGFLELDGSVKSIAVYPDLAAYLGTTFNKGDEGAGNFRLPESRGEFLRGWDHGRGVDAGREIGTYQADMLKAHNHRFFDGTGATMDPAGGVASAVVNGNQQAISTGAFISNVNGGDSMQMVNVVNTVNTGGIETRGRNLAVMWCIKAWNAPINQGNIDIAALEQRVRNNEYGRLLRTIEFTVNGTYIPSSEMKSVRVRMVGASGGSGGTPATSSTQYALSGGTGSGSYAEALLTAAQIGESQEVLIGAAGIAGAPGGNGGNGGTTSLGSLVSAPGSSGGGAGPAFAYTNSFITSGAAGGAMPSGANLIARRGSNGTGPINVASGTLSGAGGDSEFGAGGAVSGLSGAGYPGTGPGAGSSGIATPPSTAARSGVAGMPGKMLLEEYA
jgi:microcystin-dependent protein